MSIIQTIGVWLSDYRYLFRGAWHMLRYRTAPHHYRNYVVRGKVPVVLIPGILGKWSFMKELADAISLEGHPVFIVPELGYNIYSIPSSAKKVRAFITHMLPKRGHHIPRIAHGAESIESLMSKENLHNVVLVAHSKGGLIGKYLLAHFNRDSRVLGMVSIATPYSGAAMAKLIPHDSFKELLVDSQVIADLERHKKANERIISILPEYDNHVWENNGSVLEGAENITVEEKGHHRVLFSQRVTNLVIKSIECIAANGGVTRH